MVSRHYFTQPSCHLEPVKCRRAFQQLNAKVYVSGVDYVLNGWAAKKQVDVVINCMGAFDQYGKPSDAYAALKDWADGKPCIYMEMCLAHSAAFDTLLETFNDALQAARDGAKVVLVCKNGKDRSVLLARALLEAMGPSAEGACSDMLLLHCWRRSESLLCSVSG